MFPSQGDLHMSRETFLYWVFTLYLNEKQIHIKTATKFAVHGVVSLSNEILEVHKAIDPLTVLHAQTF